jgi:regulator of protease activity HflC (stomatin/prohibitin superfamily)
MLVSVGMMFIMSGCYMTTVDSGEGGVEVIAGKVTQGVIEPGFAFSLNPLAELDLYNTKAKMIDMNRVNQNKEDTTEVMYESPVTILTSENLTVPIDISILYRVQKPQLVDIRTNYGIDTIWEPKIIVKKARAVSREAIGKASVYDLNKNRSEYEKTIIAQLGDKLGKYVTVEQVNINNIPLPEKIREAVEAKMVESENAKKAEYKLATIKMEAQQEVEKKKGIAEAQKILTKSITPSLIKWKELEIADKIADAKLIESKKWDGVRAKTEVRGVDSAQMLLGLDNK